MFLFSHISIQERVDLANNLSVMLKSGIPIDEALGSLGDQSDDVALRNVLYGLRKEVENGTPLSLAFKKEAPMFGHIFVSMIRAGEQSGTLQENLLFLADLLARSADLKREVGAATLYPKMVFSAAILLGGGLAVFILPRLTPLFSGLHIELPLMTRVLLAFSEFVTNNWHLVLVALVALVVLSVFLYKIRGIRRIFHSIAITAPFLGTFIMHYHLAFITQLFGTLLRSGLTLNESVDIVREATSNIRYEEALAHIKDRIEKGDTLATSIGRFGNLFPKLTVSIIAVGEKSGTLANSFAYLAELYTKDVNIRAKKLPTIIEPILLVFIAALVGFVALSIIMPIYELTGNMSR